MRPKEQLALRQKQLRDAARQQDPAARATVEMVELMLVDVKEALVDAAGDDMLRIQGAARLLQRVYRELTVEPPSIKHGAST